MTGPDASARPGRPRSEGVTTRILNATVELLLETGIEGTTIHSVAARAGVSRPTIYLRWPHLEQLLNDAIRRAMGRPAISASGDLEADLRAGAHQARAIFASRAFLAVFPTLVGAVLRERSSPGAMSYDLLAPGRERISQEYAELAGAAGLRTDLEPELVMDLIIGGVINRVLATGRPATAEFADQAIEVIIAGLRAPRARSG